MSFTQRLLASILPDRWYARIRASSEQWMNQCTHCGAERSVWSIGGVRFGAASVGKRLIAECSTCHRLVAARIYFRDSASEDPPTVPHELKR